MHCETPLAGTAALAASEIPGFIVTNLLRFSAQALDSATIIALRTLRQAQKWRK
jgi:hypothetical protein